MLRKAGYADAFALTLPRLLGENNNNNNNNNLLGGAAGGELPPRTCWTQTRLDYIMVHNLPPRDREARAECMQVAVRSHATVESDASDHLPVVCEVSVL